jgi:hypothetical protein
MHTCTYVSQIFCGVAVIRVGPHYVCVELCVSMCVCVIVYAHKAVTREGSHDVCVELCVSCVTVYELQTYIHIHAIFLLSHGRCFFSQTVCIHTYMHI